jgi:hypothetical protein
MDDSIEIIALVLADTTDRRWHAGQLGKGAQRLVRLPDGRVSLEPVASQEEFERTARCRCCAQPVADSLSSRSRAA